MKLKLGNKIVKNYDLLKEDGRRELISNLFMIYSRKNPLFINALLTMADIDDVQKEHKEAFAYTYFNLKDERLKIHINFQKIEEFELNIVEIMFVIFHEYLHNFFYHFERMRAESSEMPIVSNIVTDYYINELLIRMLNKEEIQLEEKGINGIFQDSISEFAKEVTNKKFPFNYDDKPLENAMYKWFKDNMTKENRNKFANNSCGSESGNDNSGKSKTPLDDHEISKELFEKALKELNQKRKANGEPEITREVAQELAKYKIDRTFKNVQEQFDASNSDAEALREIEKITKKKPFLNTLKLKRVINSKLREHSIRTYKRMSRKRQSDDIVYKGKIKEYGNKVLVALDVSGSISDNDLKIFYELLNGYLSDKKDNIIDVVYWSSCEITNKNFHENIKDVNELKKFKIHSSGGTEVSYLHKFIKEHYKKQKINVINITDGYFWEFRNDLSDNIQDYYFLLTEEGAKEDVERAYNSPNVKTLVIKDYK